MFLGRNYFLYKRMCNVHNENRKLETMTGRQICKCS